MIATIVITLLLLAARLFGAPFIRPVTSKRSCTC
jgi:hypothetical protein